MALSRERALTSVGEGWSKIINHLYDELPKGAVVTDVKEKFGTLRFYVSNCGEAYLQLVDAAEDYSSEVCEFCGEDGCVREDLSWIKTLCDNCYNNHIAYLEINE